MCPLDPRQQAALEQAAHWYATLQGEDATAADSDSWRQWLGHSEENAWAWQQVERLQASLTRPTGGIGGRVLELARHDSPGNRRQVLKGLALLIGGSTLGWGGYRQASDNGLMADLRTRVGERHALDLPDGSHLQLDTDSAVDVRYSDQQRLLHLYQGTIMLETAPDPAARPFFVTTPQGLLQALGTRFSVSVDDDLCRVAVFEHRVKASPLNADPVILLQGQQGSFSRQGALARRPLDANQDAWTRGLLVANEQRLDQVVAQLARYRQGWLRCAPNVAGLRISGTFPLDDSDKALRALASSLPVRIEQRTRYWVTVLPA